MRSFSHPPPLPVPPKCRCRVHPSLSLPSPTPLRFLWWHRQSTSHQLTLSRLVSNWFLGHSSCSFLDPCSFLKCELDPKTFQLNTQWLLIALRLGAKILNKLTGWVVVWPHPPLQVHLSAAWCASGSLAFITRTRLLYLRTSLLFPLSGKLSFSFFS